MPDVFKPVLSARRCRFPSGLLGLTMVITLLQSAQAAAPFAANDSRTIQADSTLIIDVLSNDVDPDGGTLVVESVTTPANGTATLSGDGSIRYVPNSGFPSGTSGTDTFTYTVSDGGSPAETGQATVSVLVVRSVL